MDLAIRLKLAMVARASARPTLSRPQGQSVVQRTVPVTLQKCAMVSLRSAPPISSPLLRSVVGIQAVQGRQRRRARLAQGIALIVQHLLPKIAIRSSAESTLANPIVVLLQTALSGVFASQVLVNHSLRAGKLVLLGSSANPITVSMECAAPLHATASVRHAMSQAKLVPVRL